MNQNLRETKNKGKNKGLKYVRKVGDQRNDKYRCKQYTCNNVI